MKKTVGLISLATLMLSGCDPVKETPSSSVITKGIPMKTITNPSGLKYEILTEGTGATPTAGQKVSVHYTGWLDDNGQQGKEFDSSFKRNQPFSFTLGAGQVIKGWDEGVASMKVGEKRRLTIPSSLGYGARGAGGAIPPFATLIFDVELLGVQ